VIIDEAYVDFGAETAVPLTAKYDNLLVIQTFSKSRMLAGARLGMIIGNAALIEDVKKVKYSFNPYNVSRLTDILGAGAMEDVAYFEECRNRIIETRMCATERFKTLGFTVLPSSANFLFVKRNGLDGGKYYSSLKENGVLVRHFDHPKINDFVRVTIGTPAEMDVLFMKTEEILKAEKLL
jgi:Histidinol-phosphate/aromatic aminotransferase and cobyric acid decarboxylase